MPIAPTYPGVYIDELPSAVRTIVGVPTSIAAFVGWAPRGPEHPVRITSFADYQTQFGGLNANSPMSFALAIGDGQLYVCPEFNASFRTASLADPTSWTALPSPTMRAPNWGSAFLDYDEAHHILYSSSFQGGLFRMVTP